MDNPQHFHFTSEGIKFHARPINPSDKELLQKGFSELSERSRYLRFFAIHSKLSDNELKFFTEVDGVNHVAWGVQDVSGDEPIPAGVGRFVKLKDEPDTAEVAFTVVNSYQRMGLGRILLSVLNIVAAHVGVKKFRYYVLAENLFVLDILKDLGILKLVNEGPIKIVDTNVYPNHQSLPEGPEMQKFMTTMKTTEEHMMRN